VKAGKGASRTGLPWPLASGGGYHSGYARSKKTAPNDQWSSSQDSGIAGALAFHISPEIGYFVSRQPAFGRCKGAFRS